MSKIATQIAETLMVSYAGQTVDTDTLIDRIDVEYPRRTETPCSCQQLLRRTRRG